MSFLSLESLIYARLRERLPSEVYVLLAPSLVDFEGGARLSPAVYLIYIGGAIIETRVDGSAARIQQRWLTVCSARNAATINQGVPARDAAGEIADLVITSLMGWQPDASSKPLMLYQLPDPGFITGYQTVPLVFTTEIVRRVPPAKETP